MQDQVLLRVDALTKIFGRKRSFPARVLARIQGSPPPILTAVRETSFSLHQGEILGVLGESGCGKSTLGRMVAGLTHPTAGRVIFDGTDLAAQHSREARAKQLSIQMVFQDPSASLNPRMSVGHAVVEGALRHGLVARSTRRAYAEELLERVGLPGTAAGRFPRQFSGGQRQRIGIARALAVRPRLLIADEAVSALDVSVQAQIINLFMDLRESLKLSYIFISHNVAVVRHISDRVLVMYLGRVIEAAPAGDLFAAPNHPYTQALLKEAPTLERRRTDFMPIPGEMPSPLAPPSGCHFHPRCPHAFARCRAEAPVLRHVAADRVSACHLNDDS